MGVWGCGVWVCGGDGRCTCSRCTRTRFDTGIWISGIGYRVSIALPLFREVYVLGECYSEPGGIDMILDV